MQTDAPILIGWRESVDLPMWGVGHLTAKADTGARRSAIDVDNITELPGDRVQFEIAVDRSPAALRQTIVAPIAHRTLVRSSNGQAHERYFVKTLVCIGSITREIELSLSHRHSMQHRLLLGRLALEGSCIVDCSQTFITRPNLKPKITEPQVS